MSAEIVRLTPRPSMQVESLTIAAVVGTPLLGCESRHGPQWRVVDA